MNMGLFSQILRKYCKGRLKEPFGVKDVAKILGPSKPFLAKHSIDKKKPFKIVYGHAYFERVAKGLYVINEEFKICK